jgi:hypothetical protein
VTPSEGRRALPAAPWLLAAIVLTLCAIPRIASLKMYDPDDSMRLLEVRAWLAGQSWWDVRQYGFAGNGLAMHWSRLVDLPLAGVIVVLRPIVGMAAAERVAAVVVPLLTMGIVMLLVGALARRLAGPRTIIVAMLMVALTAPLLGQLQPLRIDHHGWQIATGLLAATALILWPDRRGGIVAGTGAALLVTISFEGFPFAMLVVATGGLAWVADAGRAAPLRAMGLTLTVATTLAHVATRGPDMLAPACDAIAPGWLAVIAVAGIGVAAATLAAPRTPTGRFLLLAMAGTATIIAMLVLVRDCAAGPFGMLDPLTRRVWFLNIPEGLPIWDQRWPTIAASFALPVLGIAATFVAARRAQGVDRTAWTILFGLLVGATLCGMIVLRSAALANALAIPSVAAIVTARLAHARAIPRTGARLGATLLVIPLAAPGLALSALLLLLGVRNADVATLPAAYLTGVKQPCPPKPDVRPLLALPTGATVLAPLDIGPDIVLFTHLRPVASGYHRNAPAMRFVIASFMADPALVRTALAMRQVDYVIGCPGISENLTYSRDAPHGLWARLERGERFDWLRPVAIPGSPILAWRVIRPLATTRP